MKKFLLVTSLLISMVDVFGQTIPCPISYKRNNGNSCDVGGVNGTGGSLEVGFATQPPANLQIYLIVNNTNGGTATIVESTKTESQRAGAFFANWCFETDNLGPISQGNLTINFYIDVAPFNEYNGEPLKICSNASLPVRFLSFSAQQSGGKVSLNWQTAQELNNKEFQVQRKLSNGGWETISTVPSKAYNGNSSSVLDYNFDDVSNLEGKGQVYYRIMQVDLDSRSSYSEIRSIRNNAKKFNITLYPNPGRDLVKVTIPDGAGLVDVSVSDLAGKEVMRWNATSQKNLQITNLKPGMYTVRVNIRETGEMLVDKLLIQ